MGPFLLCVSSSLLGVRFFASPKKPKKYKLKSNRTACKRFKVRGDGTVLRKQVGCHHKMRYNSTRRSFRKAKPKVVPSKTALRLKRMMLKL
jgi:ribosomal protein L35